MATAPPGYQPLHNGPYGHNARIFDVGFSPAEPDLLASASDDECVKVWRRSDAAHGPAYSLVATCHDHTDSVLRVNWSPDGSLLASGGADGVAHLFSLPRRAAAAAGAASYGAQSVHAFKGHEEEVYACEFLGGGAAGRHLCTASSDSLFLWDLETGAFLQRCSPPVAGKRTSEAGAVPERWQAGYVFSVRRQPAGKLLAAACSDGSLRTWHYEGGGALKPGRRLECHRAIGSAVAFAPDGHHLASVAKSGEVVLWDMRKDGQVGRWQAGVPVMQAAFLPGHALVLAAAGGDGSVHLMDLGSQLGGSRALSPASPSRPLLCVAPSPDGSMLAASGEAVSLDTEQGPGPASDAGVPDDSMFSPLGGAGRTGRVVFSTQQSAEAGPQHQPGAGQSKWCRIDVWQQRL